MLSKKKEMIWREVNALSGDLSQVADNLKRDAEERLAEAERLKHAQPGRGVAMRMFDLPGLVRDLTFIKERLELLLPYISPDEKT